MGWEKCGIVRARIDTYVPYKTARHSADIWLAMVWNMWPVLPRYDTTRLTDVMKCLKQTLKSNRQLVAVYLGAQLRCCCGLLIGM